MSITVPSLPHQDMRLYTAKQAAAALGVHVNTVYKWLDDGTLKATRVGSRRYIKRGALEAVGVPTRLPVKGGGQVPA